jgi:hypothetical protein
MGGSESPPIIEVRLCNWEFENHDLAYPNVSLVNYLPTLVAFTYPLDNTRYIKHNEMASEMASEMTVVTIKTAITID